MLDYHGVTLTESVPPAHKKFWVPLRGTYGEHVLFSKPFWRHRTRTESIKSIARKKRDMADTFVNFDAAKASISNRNYGKESWGLWFYIVANL